MSKTIMLVGCGDVGSRLAVRLLQRQWTVYGGRRDISQLPALVKPVAVDISHAAAPSGWPTEALDYVVYCVAASQHDEAGYQKAYVEGLRHCLSWLAQAKQQPRRVIFASSTSVYGQHHSEWIDEESTAEASGYSAQAMRAAEQLLLSAAWPATVLRLSGIYGPGRQYFLNQVRKGYCAPAEPLQYTNRIHADDAAGLLERILLADIEGAALAECYLGVDDEPAPLHEVIGWLREQMGVTQVLEQQVKRRAGSKRCRNARARALGWAPQYPSFRQGFAAHLAATD